jgi:formylglycine-generating enzyme required for sulfatase activity
MMRVVRGGAWNVAPTFCRSASRAAAHPWVRAADVGFRVAMDVTLLK